MKRRVALKQLLMASAVAAIMPSCVFDKKKKEASVVLNHLPPISESQEETLMNVCDTIIPETKIPGAKALAAHLFVFKMVDDCYDEKTQNSFLKGLSEIDALSNEKYGDSFSDLNEDERITLLNTINATDNSYSEDINNFFSITKNHTIQGFMVSEFIMTKFQGYRFVPGYFNGCVQISNPANS